MYLMKSWRCVKYFFFSLDGWLEFIININCSSCSVRLMHFILCEVTKCYVELNLIWNVRHQVFIFYELVNKLSQLFLFFFLLLQLRILKEV